MFGNEAKIIICLEGKKWVAKTIDGHIFLAYDNYEIIYNALLSMGYEISDILIKN